MAKKYAIAQLIKDEWETLAIEPAQRAQFHSGADSAPERKTVVSAPDWVETYAPSNCDRYEYYRYVWMEARRLRHRHLLPGGNIQKPSALALKEKVDRAIASGISSDAIVQIITSSANC